MSKHEYDASLAIEKEMYDRNWPYYAIIMAAMRRSDSDNLEKLIAAFPWVWEDLHARYNAPGGVLPTDEFDRIYE